jgi:hypothetical protein
MEPHIAGELLLTAVFAMAVTGSPGGNAHGAPPSGGLLGGPSVYAEYAGTAVITRVEKTDRSRAQAHPGGPGYEGFEVAFMFTTERRIAEPFAERAAGREQLFLLTNSWYPGERYVAKYGLAVGKAIPCVMKVIRAGSSSPVLFDLKGVNPSDYFESQTQAAAGPPGGVVAGQTSDDPAYGYNREKPVKVGGPRGFSGSESERLYLRHLRDAQGRPLRFERRGGGGAGPDGHIVDLYDLTGEDGTKHTLYLDMYHPEEDPLKALAPKGLHFAR